MAPTPLLLPEDDSEVFDDEDFEDEEGFEDDDLDSDDDEIDEEETWQVLCLDFVG